MSPPPNAELLRKEIVDWLIREIEAAAAEAQSRKRAEQTDKPGLIKGIWTSISQNLSQTESKSLREAWAIQERKQQAYAKYKLLHTTTQSNKETLDDIVEDICARWNQRSAVPLARAWLNNSKVPGETVMNANTQALAAIVGVATAAVVLAIVLWVRRGKTANIRRHKFAPSEDYRTINELASQDRDVARVMERIRSQAVEPWSWSLAEGLEALRDETDKRTLLRALSSRNLCGVEPISTKAGDKFDETTMVASKPVSTDDVWLVSENVSYESCGFWVRGKPVLHAKVDVCTADYWVLVKQDCEVGRFIVERGDSLLGVGPGEAFTWRATWGLMVPKDLRNLPETVLDVWRRRLIQEINPYYTGRQDRQLILTGMPGEPLTSLVDTEDGERPIGDAFVQEAVMRGGVPQYGLVCPGGSPLLLAIVKASTTKGTR